MNNLLDTTLLTPDEQSEYLAILEVNRRIAAKNDLIEYAKYIDIPGVPVVASTASDDDEVDPETGLRTKKSKADGGAEEFYADSMTPALHHKLIMQTLMRVESGEILRLMILAPPGSAKALALDTPIPTPNGWSKMGDLKVGDKVFDENGNPCNVTWVSSIWENRPVYRVRTDCGDEIIADKDHEWKIRLCGKSEFQAIRETWEFDRKRSKRPMITRAKALVLPPVELPIDPYLLGVWLGDGHSAGLRITSGEQDIVWMRSEIERLGYKTSDSSIPTLFGVLGVRDKFIRLGLINDPRHNTHGKKYIPQIYMRASIEQRISLLQGLIDTDGTVCKKRGCASFTNTNLGLALQVRELVRSLGIKAGWSESRAMLHRKGLPPKYCGQYYQTSFYFERAARMPRKASRCRNQYRTPNTYIDVVKAGYADTICIEVDSPSHLFLCGKSMTPTHNSTMASIVFPTWYMGKNPGHEIIKVTYGDSLARKFGRKCRSVCKSKKYKEVFDAELSPGNGAADAWSITNGSSYMCGGVLAGQTGNRANLLIGDDVFKNRAEADSPTVQERTWEEYKSSLRTRIKPGGKQVIINTRWNLNDLSGHILPDDYAGQTGWIKSKDDEDWYVLCITAECVRNDDPLGRVIGEFLWLEWFSVKFWQNEKRVQGERNWNALYQQTPIPDGGSIFKREWFRLLPANREIPHLVFVVQSYDTAFTKESINDPTACTVWGVFKRAGLEEKDKWEYCVLLLDAWEKYLEYPVLRYTLKDDYKATYGKQKKRVNLLLIEEKGSGQSVIQDLRLAGLPIRGYNPGKASKETRAHIASPIVESGRVYLPESANEQGEVAEWAKPFFKQVCSFPHAPNKDYTDTMTQLLIFLEHQDFLSLSSVSVNDPDEPEYAVEDKTDSEVSIYG